MAATPRLLSGTDDGRFLTIMPDGTLKQTDPFTRTQVWTVPGRADRPLPKGTTDPQPLSADAATTSCAFCSDRYLETTPEKSRSVARVGGFERQRALTLPEVLAEPAEFRRIPNLFEIISVDYWQTNHGYRLPQAARTHWRRYTQAAGGREHLLQTIRIRLGSRAAGLSDSELVERSAEFFGSAHDVVIGRRHITDGATMSDQLASSGTLTPAEHREYIDFTLDAMADLYATNPHIRYVATFQNWLRPAGASFEHLHKQLVGIDEHGPQIESKIHAAARRPDVFNDDLLNVALRAGLVVATNDHAIAIAGFGHRFPSLEVWSTSELSSPWQLPDAERDAVADLVHAMHAAAGPDVPSNEEWHHRPPDVDVEMPWHVVLKWRVSTLAGFEGSTTIYLNTISPFALRDRVVPRLRELRDEGRLAEGIRIGDECAVTENPLHYNDA